ncbi:hypothetical protein ACHAW5_010370, partial [Stephanodiscus triporus]
MTNLIVRLWWKKMMENIWDSYRRDDERSESPRGGGKGRKNSIPIDVKRAALLSLPSPHSSSSGIQQEASYVAILVATVLADIAVNRSHRSTIYIASSSILSSPSRDERADARWRKCPTSAREACDDAGSCVAGRAGGGGRRRAMSSLCDPAEDDDGESASRTTRRAGDIVPRRTHASNGDRLISHDELALHATTDERIWLSILEGLLGAFKGRVQILRLMGTRVPASRRDRTRTPRRAVEDMGKWETKKQLGGLFLAKNHFLGVLGQLPPSSQLPLDPGLRRTSPPPERGHRPYRATPPRRIRPPPSVDVHRSTFPDMRRPPGCNLSQTCLGGTATDERHDNDDDDDDVATIGSPILQTLGLTTCTTALAPPRPRPPHAHRAASSSSHSLMHHDSAQDIHDRDTHLRNLRCILSSMARTGSLISLIRDSAASSPPPSPPLVQQALTPPRTFASTCSAVVAKDDDNEEAVDDADEEARGGGEITAAGGMMILYHCLREILISRAHVPRLRYRDPSSIEIKKNVEDGAGMRLMTLEEYEDAMKEMGSFREDIRYRWGRRNAIRIWRPAGARSDRLAADPSLSVLDKFCRGAYGRARRVRRPVVYISKHGLTPMAAKLAIADSLRNVKKSKFEVWEEDASADDASAEDASANNASAEDASANDASTEEASSVDDASPDDDVSEATI